MKQSVQSEPKQPQNGVSSARSARRTQTFEPGDRVAQLAAMANNCPRVQALAQLRNDRLRSGPVENLMQLAAEINQGPSDQWRDAPVDGAGGLERGADTPEANSAEAVAQREEIASPAPNHTGLPDQLKSGVERLSGVSLDGVKVHYNSPQPAQLNALAYAQGAEIHVGPGQEEHLPHEAWHVVQQAQGRVRPTLQMMEGIPVNDDPELEGEADRMGAKALRTGNAEANPTRTSAEFSMVKQRRPVRVGFENSGQLTQLKEGVVQCIGFKPGQPKQVVAWIVEHGLAGIPIFAGIVDRFQTHGTLADNDAEAITMLFLTKETPYREFAQADLAIRFIFWDAYGFSIPRAVTTVGEFSNAFKTFYHLYRRAVNNGRHNPVQDVYVGFQGLDQALGNVDAGAVSFNTDESGSGPDVHIAIIQNFAENNQLAFPSVESAISHLIKHGTLFNPDTHGYPTKLSGHEPPEQLQDVYNAYILRANWVVANGAPTKLDDTLGKAVFAFQAGEEKAIVSFDAATSSAELTTYFPTEPLDLINDQPAAEVSAHKS